ncbi:MAG: trypsin-like peptidase domain-containing protein [Reyranellaceae bacterium]
MLQTPWAHLTPTPAEAAALDEVLLTIVAHDEGKPRCIGNSFVIAAQGRQALCMTAAHVLEEARALTQPKARVSHASMPDVFQSRGPHLWNPGDVAAIATVGDELIPCAMKRFNYVTSYDVALFIVEAPHQRSIFSKFIALDFGAPSPGDVVAVAGHQFETSNHQAGLLVERKLRILGGTVGAVAMLDARQKQKHAFDMTIPVEAGLSGSPIIRDPMRAGTLTACGVVSSDISRPEAIKDSNVAGDSVAAMLWPAAGLFVPTLMPGESVQHRLFSDLMASKTVANVSDRRVSARAEKLDEGILISYVDARRVPTETVQVLLAAPLPKDFAA